MPSLYTGCPKKSGTQIKIDITQKLLYIIQFCKNQFVQWAFVYAQPNFWFNSSYANLTIAF